MRKLVLILAALAMVAVISACGTLGQSSSGESGDSGGEDKVDKEQPEEHPQREADQEQTKQIAPQKGTQEEPAETANAVDPPSDETFMKLTVPKMAQIEDDEIPTGLGNEEPLFRDYAAVHLKYTGFPWEQDSNVYIAGHLMGYENTPSYRAFYDLDDLKKGDEIYITDSDGREYTYEVFNKFTVQPTNLAVLAPVEGKNIVTLQTCTPPDYTQRLIVRAELKDIEQA